MKPFKYLIVIAGLLGVASIFLPMAMGEKMWDMRQGDGGGGIVYPILLGFIVMIAAGGMAIAKGPAKKHHGFSGMVGAALIMVGMRQSIEPLFKMELMKGEIGAKMLTVGFFLGLVASLLALLKPEEA